MLNIISNMLRIIGHRYRSGVIRSTLLLQHDDLCKKEMNILGTYN